MTAKKIKSAYIAFSIHGTNTFIIATQKSDAVIRGVAGFSPAVSRKFGQTNPATKIHWDKLFKADGTAHTDPSWVIRRFNELKKLGWKVDDAKFREYHFGK